MEDEKLLKGNGLIVLFCLDNRMGHRLHQPAVLTHSNDLRCWSFAGLFVDYSPLADVPKEISELAQTEEGGS